MFRIDPFWIESEIFAGKPSSFGIGRKGSGYQVNFTVDPGCHPMNGADKGVASAPTIPILSLRAIVVCLVLISRAQTLRQRPIRSV
jgi:hypothetical protein